MMLPTPYYQRDGITLYHGDCRDILPQLAPHDVILTDPVWPNAVASLAGSDDPAALFAQAAAYFPGRCQRAVIHLGCDSDPRFLRTMPAALRFFRVCWLPYAVPGYKGRLLYSGDVAYAFGTPPPSRPGRHVIDGEAKRSTRGQTVGHPCARNLDHVRWIVSRFADGPILDPFCGIGTTLLAAREAGLPATGIEVEERFCATVVQRLSQRLLAFSAN